MLKTLLRAVAISSAALMAAAADSTFAAVSASGHDIWSGGPDCLVRKIGTGASLEAPACAGGLLGVSIDKQGRIWAASSTQLFQSDGESLRLAADGWNGIAGIAAGASGEAWIAAADGVWRFDGERRAVWTGSSAVRIAADRIRGDVYFIAADGLLRRIDAAVAISELPRPPDTVTALAVDEAGELSATMGGALWRLTAGGAWLSTAVKASGKAAVADLRAAAPAGSVASWKFEEPASPSLDSSGGGHNGVWNGAVSQLTPGKDGAAIQSQGGYVQVPISGAADPLRALTSVTVSAWVKPDGNNFFKPLLGFDTGSVDLYRLEINDRQYAGVPTAMFGVRTNLGQVSVTTTNALPVGVWTLVTGTFDGANGTAKIYLNGALAGTNTVAGAALEWAGFGTGNVYLAGDPEGNRLGGGLDEALIYNRALTDAEVAAIGGSSSGPEIASFTITRAADYCDIGCIYKYFIDIALTGPAPAGGVAIPITFSNPALIKSFGPSHVVYVLAGASSGRASFSANRRAARSSEVLRVTGALNGATKFAEVTIEPPGVQGAGITGPPFIWPDFPSIIASYAAINSSRIAILLDIDSQGDIPVPVSVVSSDPALIPNASLVIPGYESSAGVDVTLPAVSVDRVVTLTFTLDGYSAPPVVKRITLSGPALILVSASPNAVVGGTSTLGSVSLNSTSPEPVVLTLRSNNAAVSVPPTVTVPAGLITANFPITTTAVSTVQEATITATVWGRFATTVLRARASIKSQS